MRPLIVTIAILIVLLLVVLFYVGRPRFLFGSTKYGRIEGTLLLDGAPAPAGQRIALHLSEGNGGGHKGVFHGTLWEEYVETGEGGRFLFSSVPEGEVGLGLALAQLEGTPVRNLFGWIPIETFVDNVSNREMSVIVREGETTTVVLGTGGRNVQGRFKIPKDIVEQLDRSQLHGSGFATTAAPEPTAPEGLSGAAKTRWWQDFYVSPEGIAWRESLQRMYVFRLGTDGAYLIRNVFPGTYDMRVSISEPVSERNQEPMPRAVFRDTIVVPPLGETEARDWDLGELRLTWIEPIQIGAMLPVDLMGTTKSGTIDLKTNRGAPLLLYLMWSYGDELVNFLKGVQGLASTWGNGSDLSVIGFDMEPEDSNADYWVAHCDIDVDLRPVTREDSLRLSEAYGVYQTTLFLADAEGAIVAIENDPTAMGKAIARYLEASPK